MTKRERMRELYEKADNIKPFAEKNGQLYVSFEDASVLNSLNQDKVAMLGRGLANETDNALQFNKGKARLSAWRFQ